MQNLHTRRDGASGRTATTDRPRSPGIAYAVVTLALAVLVGALALTSRQTPPPTIAEFAPQAVEQISESSNDAAGSAAGSSVENVFRDEQGRDGATESPTVDVARVRLCVGDPPRQIEDPQSPPCVPYWSGDNGGATARGVTRDEIRVVMPTENTPLVSFFNRRFELYGRRIRVIARTGFQGNPTAERAAARAVYEEDKAFAATDPNCDACQAYLDELARLGIIGVSGIPALPESYLAAHRPYVWSYPMANDRLFALTGDWFCARFGGRNAVHAGDPVLQGTRRKAGAILQMADWEGTSVEPMQKQLATCGERAHAATMPWLGDSVVMQNVVLDMKTNGVTTLACFCNVFFVGVAMRTATNQAYYPEWLVTSYLINESASYARTFYQAPDQMRNMMMLLVHPMERPYEQHASTWAVVESNGPPPTSSGAQQTLDETYRQMLLLASGFQMAGPNLTADSFERGLHRARFPNPAHRIMAGAAGFHDGDHSMTDDAAEIWWSSAARGPYVGDAPGAFCYVDGGARRKIGTFPADDPFFSGPCDVGVS